MGLPMPHNVLTQRQLQVLRHATRSNRWIAGRLGLATRTVKNHFWSIGHRLGLPGGSRCTALMEALRWGIIALDEIDPADDERRPLPSWHWEWMWYIT